MAFNTVMIISHNYSKHKIIKRSHIESLQIIYQTNKRMYEIVEEEFKPGDLAKSLFAQNA